MILKKITLLILILLITIINTGELLSQSNNPNDYSPNIMPASPEAFKFGSYGNIPVGLFTGAPNINIPLLTFNVKEINLPISLNYASNGIRLDEMNGSTGLGWTLISAGIITRTVRDMPDENTTEISPAPNIDSLGLWSPDVATYIIECQQDGADSEPDLYMANFAGVNIKFVYDKKGQPFFYTKSNYKVIGQSGGESFTIISDKGVEYLFSAKERSLFSKQKNSEAFTYTSAWYLTKITTANDIVVNIDYLDNTYTTVLSQSQTMLYTVGTQYKLEEIEIGGNTTCQNVGFSLPAIPNNIHKISSGQTLFGKQIERIYHKDGLGNITQAIDFSYLPGDNKDFRALENITYKNKNNEILDYDFQYYPKTNGRMFLKSITNTKSNEKYEFDYINREILPQRLSSNEDVSTSRDMWGLFNGKNNNTLIPQIFEPNDPSAVVYNGADQSFVETKANSGLLNKITYPTKGYTDIIYQPHYQEKKITIPATKTRVSLNVTKDAYELVKAQSIKIKPKKDEFIKINVPKAIFYDQCDSDVIYPHPPHGVLSIREDVTSVDVPLFVYSPTQNGYIIISSPTVDITPNSSHTEYFIHLKKDRDIIVKLEATRPCSKVSIDFSYTNGEETTQTISVPFGGFRVSSTIDNYLYGDQIVKKYTYSNVKELRKPYFFENQVDRSYCGLRGAYNELYFKSITSSNLTQLNATNPNIFYENVTEEIQGKGSIVHTFDINSDYFGKNLVGNPILSSPWTNFGWKNGREIITTYKDVAGKTIKEVKNKYTEDPGRKDTIDGISIRKNYKLQASGNITIACTRENIDDVYIYHYCSTKHDHIWSSLPWQDYQVCTQHNAKNTTKRSQGFCFGESPGTIKVYPNIFENLDVVQYKNISYFDYLESQSNTDFLNGVPLKTNTEYFYDNPNHYQLTGQQTIFPDGSGQLTNYSYAHEKGKTLMIEKNMVGIPLEITAKKGSKVLSRTLTDYPDVLPDTQTGNLLLPTSASSLDMLTGGMSTAVTYDQYDTKGNLLQYTTRSGIPTAIVWGYNNTQPIAKVEGATYAQVSDLASTIISASNADGDLSPNTDESALLSALDAFRKKETLAGFQITTYTYDPLIGVRSITPPSGIREIYIYDDANRLKEVRDINGRILKENKYNYKH